MEKQIVMIERAPNGEYWCSTNYKDGGFHGAGKSVEAAKADLMECLQEAQSMGEEIPTGEFEYKYDIQAFFDAFPFFNINEIARRAGINPSLLRQYKSGTKKAGEKTYQRLSVCMEGIKTEMRKACF